MKYLMSEIKIAASSCKTELRNNSVDHFRLNTGIQK